MKRARVVVGVEMPLDEAIGLDPKQLAKKTIGDLRKKAEKMARDVGGYIDSTVNPEIRGPLQGQSYETGQQVISVAAEIVVIVPDSFDVEAAAMADAYRWVDWA